MNDIEQEERAEESIRTIRHGLPAAASRARFVCRPAVAHGRCWSRGCSSCNAARAAQGEQVAS